MTLSYGEPIYIEKACTCGRHSLHRVFRYLWQNPGAGLKTAAKELHISHDSTKQAASRLRRLPDVSRRCPECFKPSLQGLACASCGAELDTPQIPEGIRFEDTSPVHTIQPLNGLGSSTNYQGLSLSYGARNVAHLVEKIEDPFLENCKSKLWQELKEVMPPDLVVEEAARMLTKEIIEFRARYPGLVRAKGAADQLVLIVLKRLALRYPALRKRVTE